MSLINFEHYLIEALSKKEVDSYLESMKFGIEIEVGHTYLDFESFKILWDSKKPWEDITDGFAEIEKYFGITITDFNDVILYHDSVQDNRKEYYYLDKSLNRLFLIIYWEDEGLVKVGYINLNKEYPNLDTQDTDQLDKIVARSLYYLKIGESIKFDGYRIIEEPIMDDDLWTFIDSSKADLVLTQDNSVSSGIELVSNPMSYEQFCKFVPKTFNLLAEAGFYGDATTGFHIGISHESINLTEKLKTDYLYYREKGYSQFFSIIAAMYTGMRAIFKFGSKERELDQCCRTLGTFLEIKDIYKTDHGYKVSIKDLIYKDDIFSTYSIEKFWSQVLNAEHKVSMTFRNYEENPYVEVRALGGADGFEFLREKANVEKICRILVNMFLSERKDFSLKEAYKLIKPFLRFLGKDASTDVL
ncbi:MAG: hypothetical protein QXG00_08580 [Candidatus Woesearchaeota archaeon]